MAQQYNNFTPGNTGTNFPSGNTGTGQPSQSNVPEDFDYTSFLLNTRPPVPTTNNPNRTPEEIWPQRVENVKTETGNTQSSPYGLPNSYSGWTPRDFDGVPNGTTGSSIYGSMTPSDAYSFYHGANSGYNSSNLGYSASDPDLDNNLRGIWTNDGLLGNPMTTNSNNMDYSAAREGRDMYEYAWNEWERPHSDPIGQRQATGAAQFGGKSNEQEVEELRASLFGGNRKDRGESTLSAQSCNSRQSKGNLSAKDGGSVSSKSYSDIMKESNHTTRPVRQEAHPKSSKVRSKSSSSSSTVPSHYQKTVTPPPGFESSTLHIPKEPEIPNGVDDSIGSKVQRWLQQSQEVEEGASNVTTRKKSKKKKKQDPLDGSVASFIRDWNSETTESTDPSSLDSPCHRTAHQADRVTNSSPISETFSPRHTTVTSPNHCEMGTKVKKVEEIPAKKVKEAFFDPKRIFKEADPSKQKQNTFASPSPSKNCKSMTSDRGNSTHNFFDPKRIFQSKTPPRNKDQKEVKQPAKNPVSASMDNTSSPLEFEQTSPKKSPTKKKTTCRQNSGHSDTPPSQDIGNKHTTSTPVEELHHSTHSFQDFASPTGSNWKHYLNRSNDNNRDDKGGIKNKRTIKNKGSDNNGSSPQGVAEDHINGGLSGARSDLSGSEGQNAKSRSPQMEYLPPKGEEEMRTRSQSRTPQKEYLPPKGEEEMRTRSQSRQEANQTAFKHHCDHHHHFVPPPGGSGDGIHVHSSQKEDLGSKQHSASKHNSSSQSSSKSPSKHRRNISFDEDENDNTKDYAGTSYHGAPRSDKSSKKHTSVPPQPTSSKYPGKSYNNKESEPGWKKNKTSKNSRSETRSGKPGRDKREFSRHQDSSAGGVGSNGSGPKVSRHGKDGKHKMGRNRQDSDGTSSETAAHYYDADQFYQWMQAIIVSADQFYQWMKAIVHFAIWVGGFIVFLFLVLTAYFFSTCKVWIEYILHIVKELWISISELMASRNPDNTPRWWNSWIGWFKKTDDGSQGRSRHGSGGGSKPRRGKHAETIELPVTSSGAIARLMDCDPDDAYAVLGVGDNATDEDIKKYYRKQCVLVHPDKCNLRHANDAFQVLQKGYDTLTDPEKRFDLDQQRASATEAEDMLNDFYEKMKEAMNTLNCNMCDNRHKRYPVDRPCYAARYCSRHDYHHAASEGDMWAETTHLGFKWHYYACMENGVYDITEWAKCQNLRHMESNACEVRYRIGSNTRRRHPPPFMPNDAPPPWQAGADDFRNGEEDIEELLRHLFGDRNSRTANDPRTSSGHNNSNRSSRKRRHRKKKY